MEGTGFPKGYTPADFRRDQDLFHQWVRKNYPNVIVVGPCTCDASALRGDDTEGSGGAGIADVHTCIRSNFRTLSWHGRPLRQSICTLPR